MAFLRSLVPALLLISLSTPASASSDGQDFTPQVKALFRVAACGGGDALPAGVDARMVDAHCQQLERSITRYKTRWVDKAVPYLAQIVPGNLPSTVVYPFGGGDLLTALATFPRATEITTLSLERAGDVRSIDSLRGGRLRDALAENLRNVQRLFAVAHSRTDNLSIVSKGELPGELLFVLIALKVHGYEPVSLRYFRLEKDGSIHYLTQEDIAAGEQAAKKKIEKLQVFGDMELRIRKAGDPKAPIVTYRHVAANLDDSHLARDASPIEHLKKKGRVAAMTKAASYLLWWGEFSTIRNYLLANVDFMISDSTGIPPKYAEPAGFVQETYGRFEGPFLPAGKAWANDFRKLWKDNPYKELPFRYGYPDNARHSHMMVMRRENKK